MFGLSKNEKRLKARQKRYDERKKRGKRKQAEINAGLKKYAAKEKRILSGIKINEKQWLRHYKDGIIDRTMA